MVQVRSGQVGMYVRSAHDMYRYLFVYLLIHRPLGPMGMYGCVIRVNLSV